MDSKETSFYPISIEEIAERVARRNGRRERQNKNNGSRSRFSFYYAMEFDNVKEIINDFGERIIVLQYGEIIAEGTPDEISADSRVKEIYMGSEEA